MVRRRDASAGRDLSVVPYLNGARGNGIGPDETLAARPVAGARQCAASVHKAAKAAADSHRAA